VATLIVVAAVTVTLPASAAAPDRRLPPSTRPELARIFNPKLHALGLRTTRALLQNLDTYAADPNGTHLAIYVEPMSDTFTDADYVDRFTKVTKIFLPFVFNRWKGLKSFDVCLEPLPNEDSSEAPPPITQILVTRKGVKALDWSNAALVDLLVAADKHRATETKPADVYVFFDDRLDTVPELRQAREASAER
jgi:hypothetical protein